MPMRYWARPLSERPRERITATDRSPASEQPAPATSVPAPFADPPPPTDGNGSASEGSSRSRRKLIGFYLAATIGLALVLSLPVGSFIRGPLRPFFRPFANQIEQLLHPNRSTEPGVIRAVRLTAP